ncbi:MAG: ABC transporter substrate-binding protein [Oscillospiraceae bacterium]
MKITRIIAAFAALTLGITAFAGCAGNNASDSGTHSAATSGTQNTPSTATPQKEKVELHLADMSVYGIAIFNYAKEIGILDNYFDGLDYDVNITLSEWASGVDQNSAFAAKEIDFSSMGNIPAVSGAAAGYGTKILAVNYYYDNEYVLVARADSDINSIADLKGKNLGTYVGTVTHFAIAKYLETAGLDINDVNLLNVGAEAATSLRSGDIDATVLGSVIANQLVAEGTVRILSAEQAPIYNYVVGREEFAQKYPEITVKVLELINDTWDYALAHQDEYIKFYAGASGVDEAIIAATWKENFPIKSAKDFDDNDYKHYVEFVEWMKSVEYVGADVDPDSLLDRSFAQQIKD